MISLLQENQWLNPNLSKQTIDNLKKSEFTFNRMLNELSILHECIENNTLHLAEFKLSVGTRKTLREIYKRNQQISDISLLIEAASDPVSTADTSKNILSLINKFHGDNKTYLDNVGSDARLKDISIPKNIGSEPSIIQKAALKTKELGGKAGQIAMNLFQSIVVNALTRFVKWSSSLKQDILDAKKQGSAWKMIMTKLGPSMKTAKRAPDGTITYESDSSGKSTLEKLQNFAKLNPIWSNTIIGLLINITKILSITFAGATAGTSLVIGVLAGLLLRTIAGHYLKKESWGEAFKKALIVTGLSLVGGSLAKGVFSYFKGGGFIDGAKSYFVGSPGSDQFSDASQAATGAAQSLKQLGKLALGGDAKAADAYMQKFLASGRLGETQYRIMKTAFDAGLIDKEKFFSGNGPDILRLGAQLRGNVPVSINGVSVINYLTPEEASNAYTAMEMAKMMGNPVDEDTFAKLATKAGQAAQSVKESVYKTLIKKLYI